VVPGVPAEDELIGLRPSKPIAAAVAAVAIAPLVLLVLHGLAFIPLSWSEQPLAGWQPSSGHAFVAPLNTMWMSRHVVGESPAQILENGVALSCHDIPPPLVAERGSGRFMLADGQVYVSTSDNSDPRTNGRRYAVRWPTPPPAGFEIAFPVCATLALAGLILIAFVWRAPIRALLLRPPLALSLSIFAIAVILHRAWFFLDVPLPGVQPDSTTYYAPARDLLSGNWPRFEVRPPAYPVLLAMVLGSMRSLIAVTVVQTLLTIASGLVLITGAHRLRRSVSLWVALAMTGYATGFWPLQQDTSILSESLYASSLVFGVGFLMNALAGGGLLTFAAASASLALAILTRPAGVFLVVPYVFTVTNLLRTGRSRREAVAFAMPFALLLGGMAAYNRAMARTFTVTAWGEANLAVATFTMWEPRADFPDDVNQKIVAIRDFIRLSDDERHKLATTWSPTVLAPVFLKGFNVPALETALAIRPSYVESRPWIRTIALSSIRSHPKTYGKFVSSMAYMFLIDNIRWRADFADFIRGRALTLLTQSGQAEQRQRPDINDLIANHFDANRVYGIAIGEACAVPDGVGRIAPTAARRVYRLLQRSRDIVFGQIVWVAAYFVVFIAAAVRLVATRGRHLGAFVLVTVGMCAIGSAIVVCLVEYAGHRYSYPTEFVYFVVVAMAPLLADRGEDDVVEPAIAA
jgi:hypothetical protein